MHFLDRAIVHIPKREFIMMIYRILPLSALSLLLAIPWCQSPVQLRVFSSMDRPVGVEGGSKKAVLFSARGEYESFQIALLPRDAEYKLLRVESSDLVDGNGSSIARQNVTFYREHVVQVAGPLTEHKGPNRSRGPGRYADALIPFSAPGTAKLRAAPVDLNPSEVQVIWVDVFIPTTTTGGDYEGTVSVITDQGPFSVSLLVTVWDFELPLRPSLKTSFAYWKPQPDEAIEELLRHKLMPLRLSSEALRPEDSRPIADQEQDWIKRFGLSSVDAGFWSGADQGNCAMRVVPSVEEMHAGVSLHAEELFIYNFTADEIVNCKGLETPLKGWARNLHSVGVKNLVVMPPVPALLKNETDEGRSAVDIWVVLPSLFDQAIPQIREALQQGNEVWSYSALSQDSYSPKWLIDYDPINLRMHAGFLSQSLNLSGLLYWRIDRWSTDPWNNVNNAGEFGAANFPGEGLLVYPGSDIGIAGVAPSIRLKQLRDGVEDFEYVEILKRLGKKEAAITAARHLAPNWSDWSHDPKRLEITRRKLGEQIQRHSKAMSSAGFNTKGGL
jgi:hypothetical protein